MVATRSKLNQDSFAFFANLLFYIVKDTIRINNQYDTSSTARGGGGSFKKRKTIGEIGCCESRMSKQKHWPID